MYLIYVGQKLLEINVISCPVTDSKYMSSYLLFVVINPNAD